MADLPTVRDYYAAERTLLAWVRTAIAMMTFGFVVARFGIFLQEMAALQRTGPSRSAGMSVWFGIVLLTFSVIVNLIAIRQYRREIHVLNRVANLDRQVSTLALWTGIGLAALGTLMGAYLVAISGHSFAEIAK